MPVRQTSLTTQRKIYFCRYQHNNPPRCREKSGCVICSRSSLTTVLLAKVQSWSEEVDKLVNIAETEPHAAFAAFTKYGVLSSCQYFVQVVDTTALPTDNKPFALLEDQICGKLIPALTGSSSLNNMAQCLLSLSSDLWE